MILLEERPTKKVPGLTSIFVTSPYNQVLIDILRTTDGAQYDKLTKCWEFPILQLQGFLDSIAGIDDIELKVIEGKNQTHITYTQPKDSQIKLFKHQEEAVEFGLNNNKFLLLDSPGLGKTLSIIRLAEELKERKGIEHCLIVCGINTLKSNWAREIAKFSSLSSRIIGQYKSKTGRIYTKSIPDRIKELKQKLDEFFIIINIESIRDEKLFQALRKNKPNNFEFIVVDEVHKIKNHNSAQGSHMLKLTSKYQVGATGTLLSNSPLDCYVPLKWIGVEKSSYSNFRYYYCEYGGQFGNELVGYKNTTLLKDQIENISLRRKKDLLDLPPKTIITEYLEMEDKQSTFYNHIVQGIVEEVDKVELNTSMLLALVTRLRQATSCPQILTTDESISSTKIERCIDLVEQILTDPEEKVVIFTAFKETAKSIQNRLNQYNALLCTGDVRPDLIDYNIEQFQSNNINRVMVATMQKMGTGITLNRAHYAIFIEEAWTDGDQLQSEDRIHRIGQKEKVFIYRLVTKDTYDERVNEILLDKKAVGDYLIDGEIPPQAIDSLRKYILEMK